MPLFTGPPPPPSKLGRYRQLAPRAAVHVSPLVLGGMSIGDQWSAHGFGAMDKESSFALLDAYFEAGGNFIDTANNYQDGSSEAIIGEWMETRGVRDQIVLCTKYTNIRQRGSTNAAIKANYLGNNVKNMKLGVAESLKNLRTDYVDVLYLHYWDLHTSVEEIMDGLHGLVVAGKVLYLGASDCPAWWVVKANEYAKHHGKTPFAVYQGAYSVVQRDLEREVLPMCQHEGLGLTIWNVLASGHIRSNAEEERRRQTGEKGRAFNVDWQRNEQEKKVCDVLEQIAEEVGVGADAVPAVAIAYTLHKSPYIFPVVGGRKIEHLRANIQALSISLSDDQITRIEAASPFDIGWPANSIGKYGTLPFLLTSFAHFDKQPLLPPVPISKD